MLALAVGLKQANHEVRFATARAYEAQVRAAGIEFYPIAGAPEAFFGGQGGTALREMMWRPGQFQRFWNLCIGSYTRSHLRETWEASKGFDTVVCLPWFHAAPSLTEKLGAPCFATTSMPAIGVPTSEFPNPMAEDYDPDLTGWECRRSWRNSTLIVAAPHEQVNEWRTEVLGLRPLSRMDLVRSYRRANFLLSYSQSVLPTPHDWLPSVNVTGFWFMDSPTDWQPPENLSRFLEEHSAPLMVGFSSQVHRNPAAFTEKVIRAVIRSGKSAVLLTGWGGLQQTDLPKNILIQKWVPYDWIVPRLSGFLHHGGCGSMAMCLRYGVPNMAIPFGFDQALWGTRMAKLGLGPAPIEPEKIDVSTLAEALVRMTEDRGIKQRAQAMAEKIRQEDGVRTAIRAIETAS